MTARAFWLLCLIVGSSPEAPVAERKGKIGEMLSPGRGAGLGWGPGAGGEGALKGGTRKGSERAGEGTRVRVRVRKEPTVSPRFCVSWQPFRKEASSATEMISSEPGRLEKTLHVK